MTVSIHGTVKITYKEFQNIPYDGLGHHLLNGVHIVTPAPSTRHQLISANIFTSLMSYVKEHQLGKVLSAPIDVKFSEFDGYQPDIVLIGKYQAEIMETT